MKPILSLDGESKFEKLETDETETSIKIPDFEQLVTYLGHFGDYQKWLYFFLWIPAGNQKMYIPICYHIILRSLHFLFNLSKFLCTKKIYITKTFFSIFL